jgi:hypothetical protein
VRWQQAEQRIPESGNTEIASGQRDLEQQGGDPDAVFRLRSEAAKRAGYDPCGGEEQWDLPQCVEQIR